MDILDINLTLDEAKLYLSKASQFLKLKYGYEKKDIIKLYAGEFCVARSRTIFVLRNGELVEYKFEDPNIYNFIIGRLNWNVPSHKNHIIQAMKKDKNKCIKMPDEMRNMILDYSKRNIIV